MNLPQYGGTLAALSREHPLLGRSLTTHEATRQNPMSFKDRPCLVELYADARKMEDVVIQKAVQTGVSEWAVQVLFDAAGWRGRIVAYVLPTYAIRNRFVTTRIDTLLQRIPVYRRLGSGMQIGVDDRSGRGKKETGSRSLKRFGSGSILFLGSGTDNDFVEFSADVMIVDEYDRCKVSNLSLAIDRLRESPYPQYFNISNPTLPNIGISRLFDDSDKRRWHHSCERCGERQPLDWFENVVMKRDDGTWMLRDEERGGRGARPICRRCRRPFDRRPEDALWVSEATHKTTRGYHMSRLDVLSDPIEDLFKEWLKAQGSPEHIRAFYTSVLGIPYQFEGTRLSVTALEAVANGAAMDWTGGESYRDKVVTAGVDVGSYLHTQVSVIERDDNNNPVRETVFIAALRSFEEVADVLRRFHVNVAVVDAYPEIHKAQELRDEFLESGECDLWLCRFFPTPRVGAQRYGMRLKHHGHVIQVDRTSVFDVSFKDIVDGNRQLPVDVMSVASWAEQMCAPVRIVDSEKAKIMWVEGTKADHFRLADVYDRVASDLLDVGGTFSVL